MIRRLKGKETAFNFLFAFCGLFGIYLILAWASYSPLDNAWSVASTATSGPLNKTGVFGAWMIDLLYAFFGKVAFLYDFIEHAELSGGRFCRGDESRLDE